jgi:predicted nucleotidyltransferase
MLKNAVKFTNQIKGLEGILSVVLFGSVARGESTKESDVDLAVIYTRKYPKTVRKINCLAPEKVPDPLLYSGRAGRGTHPSWGSIW